MPKKYFLGYLPVDSFGQQRSDKKNVSDQCGFWKPCQNLEDIYEWQDSEKEAQKCRII